MDLPAALTATVAGLLSALYLRQIIWSVIFSVFTFIIVELFVYLNYHIFQGLNIENQKNVLALN